MWSHILRFSAPHCFATACCLRPALPLSATCYPALRAHEFSYIAHALASASPHRHRFGPLSIFFPVAANFIIYPEIASFAEKPLELHAFNNSQTVHRIKTIYICKMLRILCSFIICNFQTCLKYLNCCLHVICLITY